MTEYRFNLIRSEREGGLTDPSVLSRRPFAEIDRSFAAEARKFVPGEALETAMNTAIAVGEPLLITGEAGTGKTQAAYYAAYKLGVEPVIHFQVKSDCTARDLLYHFDTVGYFHDANMAQKQAPVVEGDCPPPLDKHKYVEKRPLWTAFDEARKTGLPRVVLIDEIDKAPRDFPNDLLHELDKMEITVTETGDKIEAPRHLRPVVFITSNSERRLPEPFLRRCVYHHIVFDDKIVEEAVAARRDELSRLNDDVIRMAIRCFQAIRNRSPRKKPATGELLVWLRVLSLAADVDVSRLDPRHLSDLPYLGVLLKDHKDISDLRRG